MIPQQKPATGVKYRELSPCTNNFSPIRGLWAKISRFHTTFAAFKNRKAHHKSPGIALIDAH